jgi:hypothetical protein
MTLQKLIAVAVAAALAVYLSRRTLKAASRRAALQPGQKDFAKMDKNNDGKLSQSEVTAGAGAGATSGSTPPKK